MEQTTNSQNETNANQITKKEKFINSILNFYNQINIKKYVLPIICAVLLSYTLFSYYVYGYLAYLIIYPIIFSIVCLFLNFENAFSLWIFMFCFNGINFTHNGIAINSICFGMFFLIFFVKYIIDVCKKKKTFMWQPFLISLILIGLSFVRFNVKLAINLIKPAQLLALLFLTVVNLKNINKEKITIYFISGILASSTIGAILFLFPELKEGLMPTEGRFQALTSNPNTLQIEIIIGLSLLTAMFFKQKIKIVPYILIVSILSIFGFLTKSKAFLLLFVLLVFIIIITIIKKYKKKGLYISLGIIVAGLLFCGIFYKQIWEIVQRFFMKFGDGGFLDSITTARYSIWKIYINSWASSAFTIIFGCGLTSIHPIDKGTHSSYIQTLYDFGIIGTIIFILLICQYFKQLKTDFKIEKNFLSYIAIIMVLLLSLEESILYFLYPLIVLSFIFLFDNKQEIELQSSEIINETNKILKIN